MGGYLSFDKRSWIMKRAFYFLAEIQTSADSDSTHSDAWLHDNDAGWSTSDTVRGWSKVDSQTVTVDHNATAADNVATVTQTEYHPVSEEVTVSENDLMRKKLATMLQAMLKTQHTLQPSSNSKAEFDFAEEELSDVNNNKLNLKLNEEISGEVRAPGAQSSQFAESDESDLYVDLQWEKQFRRIVAWVPLDEVPDKMLALASILVTTDSTTTQSSRRSKHVFHSSTPRNALALMRAIPFFRAYLQSSSEEVLAGIAGSLQGIEGKLARTYQKLREIEHQTNPKDFLTDYHEEESEEEEDSDADENITVVTSEDMTLNSPMSPAKVPLL